MCAQGKMQNTSFPDIKVQIDKQSLVHDKYPRPRVRVSRPSGARQVAGSEHNDIFQSPSSEVLSIIPYKAQEGINLSLTPLHFCLFRRMHRPDCSVIIWERKALQLPKRFCFCNKSFNTPRAVHYKGLRTHKESISITIYSITHHHGCLS